jgi:hypothetical protein
VRNTTEGEKERSYKECTDNKKEGTFFIYDGS